MGLCVQLNYGSSNELKGTSDSLTGPLMNNLVRRTSTVSCLDGGMKVLS